MGRSVRARPLRRGGHPRGCRRATAAPGAALAAGCNGSPSGSTSLTLTVGGHARTVLVHVPSSYTGTTPVALVLNLHGSGSTAQQQEEFTGMDAAADADGFLVGYPPASIPDGAGFDWNVPGEPLVGGRKVPAGKADDVTFLTRLVAAPEQRYCVDSRRVYAAGFSGGARMAAQLACGASGTFAAVATVSGLRFPAACHPRRAVPIVAFHGTADPVDPYGGHGQAYWTYSVPTAARDWAGRERCAAEPAVSSPGKSVALTRYAGCRAGSTVELYTIAGEGHEWPGGPPLPARYTVLLGPQSNVIDADRTIWAFFAAHRLP